MENSKPSPSLMADIQPSALASVSTITGLSGKRRKTERSCLLCHERKIRCDKKTPCSNCVRGDILCCYPGTERPSRRPPKSTVAEVAARVTRLERTITAISNNSFHTQSRNVETSSAVKSPSAEADVSETQSVADSPEEMLVRDGYSTRYINEVLLSRVLEEVSPWGIHISSI